MGMRHCHHINLAACEVRHITFQGVPHIVSPAVMLVTGVHNGSSGPLLYEECDLRESVPLWNGRPITVGHPTCSNSPVSVFSSPQVYEGSIGTVWNTRMEGQRLKADLYINIPTSERVVPQLLAALKSGTKIELSTGLFSADDRGRGTWGGKPYDAIVRKIQPDHLAVLLDQKGACSWEDGCGIRANARVNANISDGFQRGGTAMREQEPLVLPVLNHAEGDGKCPCGKKRELPIPDEPEALNLPLLHGRER